MVNLQIKPNTYYDSITLMIISKELKKVPGVKEALVGMGTDLNLDIAKVTGLSSPELEAITPNDFFVALDCENEQVVEAALKALEEQLNKKEDELKERTTQLIEKQEEIDNYIAETKTYDVVLRVKPEKASQIKSQIIDGQKCLVIPMKEDEHATINGVNTTV